MIPIDPNARMATMWRVMILIVFAAGCSWKPKPYAADPMGRLHLETPEALVEPLTPPWPAPPEPPL